eukprot:GHVQ01006442.1.p1 GENE.GHVQ01006442.1~~GHVQ01006442.1.p1  ORF type:complete len:2243 (-),score=212.81 GHVQ01006442.1:707-7435(-)
MVLFLCTYGSIFVQITGSFCMRAGERDDKMKRRGGDDDDVQFSLLSIRAGPRVSSCQTRQDSIEHSLSSRNDEWKKKRIVTVGDSYARCVDVKQKLLPRWSLAAFFLCCQIYFLTESTQQECLIPSLRVTRGGVTQEDGVERESNSARLEYSNSLVMFVSACKDKVALPCSTDADNVMFVSECKDKVALPSSTAADKVMLVPACKDEVALPSSTDADKVMFVSVCKDKVALPSSTDADKSASRLATPLGVPLEEKEEEIATTSRSAHNLLNDRFKVPSLEATTEFVRNPVLQLFLRQLLPEERLFNAELVRRIFACYRCLEIYGSRESWWFEEDGRKTDFLSYKCIDGRNAKFGMVADALCRPNKALEGVLRGYKENVTCEGDTARPVAIVNNCVREAEDTWSSTLSLLSYAGIGEALLASSLRKEEVQSSVGDHEPWTSRVLFLYKLERLWDKRVLQVWLHEKSKHLKVGRKTCSSSSENVLRMARFAFPHVYKMVPKLFALLIYFLHPERDGEKSQALDMVKTCTEAIAIISLEDVSDADLEGTLQRWDDEFNKQLNTTPSVAVRMVFNQPSDAQTIVSEIYSRDKLLDMKNHIAKVLRYYNSDSDPGTICNFRKVLNTILGLFDDLVKTRPSLLIRAGAVQWENIKSLAKEFEELSNQDPSTVLRLDETRLERLFHCLINITGMSLLICQKTATELHILLLHSRLLHYDLRESRTMDQRIVDDGYLKRYDKAGLWAIVVNEHLNSFNNATTPILNALRHLSSLQSFNPGMNEAVTGLQTYDAILWAKYGAFESVVVDILDDETKMKDVKKLSDSFRELCGKAWSGLYNITLERLHEGIGQLIQQMELLALEFGYVVDKSGTEYRYTLPAVLLAEKTITAKRKQVREALRRLTNPDVTDKEKISDILMVRRTVKMCLDDRSGTQKWLEVVIDVVKWQILQRLSMPKDKQCLAAEHLAALKPLSEALVLQNKDKGLKTWLTQAFNWGMSLGLAVDAHELDYANWADQSAMSVDGMAKRFQLPPDMFFDGLETCLGADHGKKSNEPLIRELTRMQLSNIGPVFSEKLAYYLTKDGQDASRDDGPTVIEDNDLVRRALSLIVPSFIKDQDETVTKRAVFMIGSLIQELKLPDTFMSRYLGSQTTPDKTVGSFARIILYSSVLDLDEMGLTVLHELQHVSFGVDILRTAVTEPVDTWKYLDDTIHFYYLYRMYDDPRDHNGWSQVGKDNTPLIQTFMTNDSLKTYEDHLAYGTLANRWAEGNNGFLVTIADEYGMDPTMKDSKQTAKMLWNAIIEFTATKVVMEFKSSEAVEPKESDAVKTEDSPYTALVQRSGSLLKWVSQLNNPETRHSDAAYPTLTCATKLMCGLVLHGVHLAKLFPNRMQKPFFPPSLEAPHCDTRRLLSGMPSELVEELENKEHTSDEMITFLSNLEKKLKIYFKNPAYPQSLVFHQNGDNGLDETALNTRHSARTRIGHWLCHTTQTGMPQRKDTAEIWKMFAQKKQRKFDRLRTPLRRLFDMDDIQEYGPFESVFIDILDDDRMTGQVKELCQRIIPTSVYPASAKTLGTASVMIMCSLDKLLRASGYIKMVDTAGCLYVKVGQNDDVSVAARVSEVQLALEQLDNQTLTDDKRMSCILKVRSILKTAMGSLHKTPPGPVDRARWSDVIDLVMYWQILHRLGNEPLTDVGHYEALKPLSEELARPNSKDLEDWLVQAFKIGVCRGLTTRKSDLNHYFWARHGHRSRHELIQEHFALPSDMFLDGLEKRLGASHAIAQGVAIADIAKGLLALDIPTVFSTKIVGDLKKAGQGASRGEGPKVTVAPDNELLSQVLSHLVKSFAKDAKGNVTFQNVPPGLFLCLISSLTQELNLHQTFMSAFMGSPIEQDKALGVFNRIVLYGSLLGLENTEYNVLTEVCVLERSKNTWTKCVPLGKEFNDTIHFYYLYRMYNLNTLEKGWRQLGKNGEGFEQRFLSKDAVKTYEDHLAHGTLATIWAGGENGLLVAIAQEHGMEQTMKYCKQTAKLLWNAIIEFTVTALMPGQAECRKADGPPQGSGSDGTNEWAQLFFAFQWAQLLNRDDADTPMTTFSAKLTWANILLMYSYSIPGAMQFASHGPFLPRLACKQDKLLDMKVLLTMSSAQEHAITNINQPDELKKVHLMTLEAVCEFLAGEASEYCPSRLAWREISATDPTRQLRLDAQEIIGQWMTSTTEQTASGATAVPLAVPTIAASRHTGRRKQNKTSRKKKR